MLLIFPGGDVINLGHVSVIALESQEYDQPHTRFFVRLGVHGANEADTYFDVRGDHRAAIVLAYRQQMPTYTLAEIPPQSPAPGVTP